ncbi:hypothetical protein [Streptomonospora nanhaiensis]|uniref:hypothetical protein n=1 Tax=Streptomonospora nanhaiensis TaxID=1323731 RepID=UPI001C38B638|nr:hypothetical protein [Streptomonospora nanhaiensis]MBV2366940.1 hypothetical protein [Streptomonospora nanhaiensis]
MTIMTHRPLGHTTRTATATHHPAALVECAIDTDGYPYIAVYTPTGDGPVHLSRVADGDPADQRDFANAMAEAWREAADRFADINVRAGGGY